MEEESGSCIVSFRVIPGSKKDEVVCLMADGSVKIKITAPPVEGKANIHLIKLLSRITGIKYSQIEIIHGEKSRLKSLQFNGSSADQIMEKLVEKTSM